MRLDVYLVENGYFESRNRALEAIKSGKVKVDGKIAKPSNKCDQTSSIEVENEKFYASRAARKLEAFFGEHAIDIADKRVLDIGSSTGGFAQILLENGVINLACVDVGTNQLHHSIREDERVQVHEKCDIRDFDDDSGFEVVTCDVSFISVLDILESIHRLASGDIVILYKPQFEVGRLAKRDSNGVVTDIDAIRYARGIFEQKCQELHWDLVISLESKVQGKEGNREYFYHFKKGMA